MAAADAPDPKLGIEPTVLWVLRQIYLEKFEYAFGEATQHWDFATRTGEIKRIIGLVTASISHLADTDVYIDPIYATTCSEYTTRLQDMWPTSESQHSQHLIHMHKCVLCYLQDMQCLSLQNIQGEMIAMGQYTRFARYLWSEMEEQVPEDCAILRDITYAMLKRQMQEGDVLSEKPWESYEFAVKVQYLMELHITGTGFANQWYDPLTEWYQRSLYTGGARDEEFHAQYREVWGQAVAKLDSPADEESDDEESDDGESYDGDSYDGESDNQSAIAVEEEAIIGLENMEI